MSDPAIKAPNREPFDALVPASRNKGDIALDALADVLPQPNPDPAVGGYDFYRIGDVPMSRNVRAAIFEARRLCMTI